MKAALNPIVTKLACGCLLALFVGLGTASMCNSPIAVPARFARDAQNQNLLAEQNYYPRERYNSTNKGYPTLPQGRRYYNGRYFGNFNNRYYGPQYGYF